MEIRKENIVYREDGTVEIKVDPTATEAWMLIQGGDKGEVEQKRRKQYNSLCLDGYYVTVCDEVCQEGIRMYYRLCRTSREAYIVAQEIKEILEPYKGGDHDKNVADIPASGEGQAADPVSQNNVGDTPADAG